MHSFSMLCNLFQPPVFPATASLPDKNTPVRIKAYKLKRQFGTFIAVDHMFFKSSRGSQAVGDIPLIYARQKRRPTGPLPAHQRLKNYNKAIFRLQ